MMKIVLGKPGAGMSRFFAKPNLMQRDITDLSDSESDMSLANEFSKIEKQYDYVLVGEKND